MDCLRCSSHMKKVDMEGVLVDLCENCKGVWLDVNELDMLKYDDGKSPAELAAEVHHEVLAEKRRLLTTVGMCPKCQRQPLVPFIRSGVELDQCPACSGLFFDNGELQKILAAERNGVKKFFYVIKKNFKRNRKKK